MKIKYAPLIALLASFPALISAIVPPGASTPLFYLVSTTSTSPTLNLLPVLLNGALFGSSPSALFYFSQGSLYALSSPTSTSPYRVFINSVPEPDCTPSGQLSFTQSGSTTNKCAQFSGFQIQSDTQNSQLGAQLVVNFQGGFYACQGNNVVYKLNPTDGPSGCLGPISLYTVPVV
ncbi:hypothetical protein K443DRAFT_681256 [Laccaria amethystina LaAM-08-1]|uniref:Ubiquitin 3 binding protein But2 C-terminal domain-containing protein n=1 Tax=Laccaria amethystina LaAM-08-1 TaxID=1095629 RepID=A0A0C9X8T0_9AGAR|nr:hypothetical protein K443DRAFT_681256 [Laccaria amethystina LaAM-08-1]